MRRSVSGDHRDHREQGEHGAAVFPRAAGPSPGTSAAAGTRAVREVERVCARGLAPDALFGALLERLRRAVPFDALCWNATDPGTLLATRVRTESMEGATAAGAVRFFENEYVWEDVAKFSALARATEPVGILSEATAGEPRRSRRYRLINGPMGLDHELRVAFVAGGGCWATASLHRRAGAPDFTRGDAAFLARVSAPVARGLRVGALLGEAPPTGRTAPDAAAAGSEYGSGVLLLDERYELVAATPAAERWLAELPPEFAGDGGAGARRPLPAAVYAAAARGRAAASARSAADAGGDAGAAQQARARVRTRSGFWLLVHAADLTARTPRGRRWEPGGRSRWCWSRRARPTCCRCWSRRTG